MGILPDASFASLRVPKILRVLRENICCIALWFFGNIGHIVTGCHTMPAATKFHRAAAVVRQPYKFVIPSSAVFLTA